MNTVSHTTTPIVLMDIFVSPLSVFERLKQVKNWSWVALAALLGLTFFSQFIFYNNMSTEWLVSQQLLYANEISMAEKAAVTQMLQQSADFTGTLNGVFSVLGLSASITLLALYFMVITKLSPKNRNYSFSDWFSFSVWTQAPMLVNLLGFILLFTTAHTQDLPLSLPEYASVNQLLLGFSADHPWFAWASSINLFQFWSIGIAAIGLRYFCDTSKSKAILLAGLPYVVFFGAWLLFI